MQLACHSQRTRADTATKKKAMKKNMYEAVMWKHRTEPLCYAIWFGNNLVRTLSNFHTPKVVDEGIKRRRKINGVRGKESVAVP